MKVALIKQELERYKNIVSHLDFDDQRYKWEVLKNFETNWNIETEDIRTMYDQSLQSQFSGNLWGGQKESPKSYMLNMMEVNPDFSRIAFRDLFAEDKELLLRLDRFGFHCQQVQKEVENKFGKIISHYHDDFKILSFYLAMRYPKIYCLFDYKPFAQFAQNIGIQDIPESYALLRFFKIMRALYNVISKDQELLALQESRLKEDIYSKSTSLLICHDFYFLCGSKEYA